MAEHPNDVSSKLDGRAVGNMLRGGRASHNQLATSSALLQLTCIQDGGRPVLRDSCTTSEAAISIPFKKPLFLWRKFARF